MFFLCNLCWSGLENVFSQILQTQAFQTSLWMVFMWSFFWLCDAYIPSQKWHWNFLTSAHFILWASNFWASSVPYISNHLWMFSMCRFFLLLSMKVSLHKLHLDGLFFLCVLVWASNFSLSSAPFEQSMYSQLNLQIPWWMFLMCLSRWLCVVNVLSQRLHWWLFTAPCFIVCAFKFCTNPSCAYLTCWSLLRDLVNVFSHFQSCKKRKN